MKSLDSDTVLLRSEYKDFVFNFTDFIWEVDANGIYTYAAGKVEEVLGYKPSEIIGKTPFDFMPEDEAQKIGKLFIETIKDRKPIADLENWNFNSSGKLVCLLTNGKAIYDSNGNFSGYQGVDKDITDKKLLEQQLLDLNKNLKEQVEEEVNKNRIKDKQLLVQSRLAQMGEIISMIAHQWRQPLTTITAIASSLKLSIDLDEYDFTKKEDVEKHDKYFKERINTLSANTQSLSNIIGDFRNFYSPTKKEIFVSITSPITKAISIIRPTFEQEKIEIIENYDTKLEILLYENELIHVIINILKNAVDNFKENSTINPIITISTKLYNELYIIEISDNGGGIPTDIMDRIFEPYFSTKSSQNGTGLGLYMSKTIVEKHHKGILAVENIYKTDGSLYGVSFRIELKA